MSLFVNKFFYLGLACLLNEFKTKTQVKLIYKQTNINEIFYRAKPDLFMINLIHL